MFGAELKGRPVAAAISAATFSEKFFLVLSPYTTIVQKVKEEQKQRKEEEEEENQYDADHYYFE